MLSAFIFLIKYGWTVLFLINVILPIKDINLYEASLSDLISWSLLAYAPPDQGWQGLR